MSWKVWTIPCNFVYLILLLYKSNVCWNASLPQHNILYGRVGETWLGIFKVSLQTAYETYSTQHLVVKSRDLVHWRKNHLQLQEKNEAWCACHSGQPPFSLLNVKGTHIIIQTHHGWKSNLERSVTNLCCLWFQEVHIEKSDRYHPHKVVKLPALKSICRQPGMHNGVEQKQKPLSFGDHMEVHCRHAVLHKSKLLPGNALWWNMPWHKCHPQRWAIDSGKAEEMQQACQGQEKSDWLLQKGLLPRVWLLSCKIQTY